MADLRRQDILRRIERVTSVDRLRALQTLSRAQSEAARSAALAERGRALADNDGARTAAITGDALLSLMRFSSAMNTIAEDAARSKANAEAEVEQASKELSGIDRKLGRIAQRVGQLRKHAERNRWFRSDPLAQQGLARKLLKRSHSEAGQSRAVGKEDSQ